jgi:hypothetical protein
VGSSGPGAGYWVGGQSWLRGRAGVCFCGCSGCHPWRREEAGGLISNKIRQEAANREASQKLICNCSPQSPWLGNLGPGSSCIPQLGHFAGPILDPLAKHTDRHWRRSDVAECPNSSFQMQQLPSGLDTLAAICGPDLVPGHLDAQNGDDFRHVSVAIDRCSF